MQIGEENYLKVAIEAAIGAGKIVRERFEGKLSIESKNDRGTDLVTEFDRKSEEYIRRKLEGLGDYFYGEESDYFNHIDQSTGKQLRDNIPIIFPKGNGWVVDPIDGTTNFVHGMENFTISIAYVKEEIPVIGVLYFPLTDQLYYSEAGHGVWHNGRPVVKLVPAAKSLHQALIALEFGGFHGTLKAIDQQRIKALVEFPVHGLRALGAASVNILNVALGKCDGYYEMGLKPWDVAAAYVIAKELGCHFYNLKSKSKWSISTKELLMAGTDLLAKELLAVLSQVPNQ